MASRFAKSEAARNGAPMRARTRAASRTFRSTVAAALILGAAADHGPAAAAPAPACGERARLLEHLDQRFAEKRQAIGLSADGGVLEILASSNGSWTILITYPNRPTCVIATGQAFENIALITAGQLV
jgi:hypothetical protein